MSSTTVRLHHWESKVVFHWSKKSNQIPQLDSEGHVNPSSNLPIQVHFLSILSSRWCLLGFLILRWHYLCWIYINWTILLFWNLNFIHSLVLTSIATPSKDFSPYRSIYSFLFIIPLFMYSQSLHMYLLSAFYVTGTVLS